MKKIELTIKTDYVREWSAWEGVRELVQNARDAHIEHGGSMSIRHDPESQRLFIENLDGGVLSTEDLLLGQTSKADRGDLAGKFGEGLKLGVLALVRAGHKVAIRSGSDVWTPMLTMSSVFKAEVLAFNIETGRKDRNRVRVEIGGISKEMWSEFAPRFRFLQKNSNSKDVVDVPYMGTILFAPSMKGHLFVKGIYVGHDDSLAFGYDLSSSDVSVDRDRKMINAWDLRWRLGSLWKEASIMKAHQKTVTEKLVDAIFDGVKDVEQLAGDSFYAAQLPEHVKEAAANRFRSESGSDAVPVKSTAEAVEAEHVGKVGVRVSDAARRVIEQTIGTFDDLKKGSGFLIERVCQLSELMKTEKDSFMRAIAILCAVDPQALSSVDIDVVTFRGNQEGLFEPKEDGSKRVFIARSTLSSWDAALEVLVHEVAHLCGGDGSVSHDRAQATLWRKIVKHLDEKSATS